MAITENDLQDLGHDFSRMETKYSGDRLKIIIGIDYGTTFSGKSSSGTMYTIYTMNTTMNASKYI